MLYDLSMSESNKYENLRNVYEPTVYIIQEIAGTREGKPKINIMGASKYGRFKFLLPEMSQIIFSPGPLVFKLRKGLTNFNKKDYPLHSISIAEWEGFIFINFKDNPEKSNEIMKELNEKIENESIFDWIDSKTDRQKNALVEYIQMNRD